MSHLHLLTLLPICPPPATLIPGKHYTWTVNIPTIGDVQVVAEALDLSRLNPSVSIRTSNDDWTGTFNWGSCLLTEMRDKRGNVVYDTDNVYNFPWLDSNYFNNYVGPGVVFTKGPNLGEIVSGNDLHNRATVDLSGMKSTSIFRDNVVDNNSIVAIAGTTTRTVVERNILAQGSSITLSAPNQTFVNNNELNEGQIITFSGSSGNFFNVNDNLIHGLINISGGPYTGSLNINRNSIIGKSELYASLGFSFLHTIDYSFVDNELAGQSVVNLNGSLVSDGLVSHHHNHFTAGANIAVGAGTDSMIFVGVEAGVLSTQGFNINHCHLEGATSILVGNISFSRKTNYAGALP